MIFIIVVGALLGACNPSVEPPTFSGERAMEYLTRQVAFGPRVPGSEASAACREFFYRHFDSLGLDVDSTAFRFVDPYTAVDTPLVNVMAHYRGDPSDDKAILLCAHYDSRPRTDYHSDTTKINQPIAGANDGASGVAVLMEIATLMAQRSPGVNVDLLLVDGEDWGRPGDHDYYCLGSREFARHSIRDKYHFGIVVDMIGDRHQLIFREEYTERFFKPVNDMIWSVAKLLQVETFRDSVRHTIIDDHLPLGAGGVPTALLIDFDYPPWHTEFDTPDKCSAESLANVGRVLTHIIYTESVWP